MASKDGRHWRQRRSHHHAAHQPRRDIKQKGTNNAGSYEASFAVVTGDTRQTALKTAQGTKTGVQDRYSSGGSAISLPVMSRTRAGGEANTVLEMGCTLEINSNVVEV